MAPTIAPVRPEDAAAVLRLLESNKLPIDGLRDHWHTTLVAHEGDRLVGSAALELYADGALLRSVAVDPVMHKRGLGRELVAAAIKLAEERGVEALYLLTTTADGYFPRFGFTRVARADVPAGVQQSVEFTSACPSSAIVMRKSLRVLSSLTIRTATLDDLPALTDIYNHYVVNTAITFDLRPLTVEERRPWFDEHHVSGPHRLLVALDGAGACAGYASTSRWRPKAAYNTTVKASVYCRPEAIGKGCGTTLYRALFACIADEDLHTIVAGVSLPNPASIALHERFGFRSVGVFHAVGRKFDQYWDVAWFERPARREPGA